MKKPEDIFLSALGSAKKLKWYLDNDINLINYLNSEYPQIMFLVNISLAFIPKNKLRAEIGEVNLKRILKIMEKERPDLYSTLIKHPNGLKWLQREIKSFEEHFLTK